jgi:hypothetical protein
MSEGRLCGNVLQRGNMDQTQNWSAMSPELAKVAEKKGESFPRKSRMVEISLSGSGEGRSRVTSPPTLPI